MAAGASEFVPDCILINEAYGLLVILEFASGLSEKAANMDEKAQAKKNQYHSTLLFLRR